MLAMVGSPRRDSFSRRLPLAAGSDVPADVRMDLWEGLRAVPAFDEDLDSESTPPAVADPREQIRAADPVLFATPEDNGSIPGVLRNAPDWVTRPEATGALRDRPVAVIGASPSPRGAQGAQVTCAGVLAGIGAEVCDVGLAIAPVHQRVDRQGTPTDDTLRRQLRQVPGRLIEHANLSTMWLAG